MPSARPLVLRPSPQRRSDTPFPDLARAGEVAREATLAAEKVALSHWRVGQPQGFVLKSDGTELGPDAQAEAEMIQVIHAAFPDHAVLGEETGAHGGGSSRWILDPIDGTKGYLRGGQHWGPVVAMEHRGEVVAGAISLPALGYRCWATRGGGAFRQPLQGGDPERLRIARESQWSDATLSLGELNLMARSPWREAIFPAITELAGTAKKARAHGDVAAFGELFLGVHAWIEVGVKWWDVAPFGLLLEEAGGRVSFFQLNDGKDERWSVVGSCPELHDHLLSVLGLA